MDGSVKEDDEDDKDMEMFMSFENRISDLPEYEISLVLHGPEVDEGNLEDSDEDVVLHGSEVDEVNLEDSEDDVVLHGFDTVAFVRRTLSTERSLGSSTVGMNFISIALSNGSCRRMLVHYVKGPQWLFER
ncbi:hypothetical protein Vadar_029496 [Vaccinium darrowii]|uniref:Uncharacterized protein n=1 Tax=Vaccinium darrowii TaxID=229202 RepID=A0ACB7ZME3_9ERIC|nr:hypothetical protein Vadar_029496 [Vaccinium darrowii]